MKLNVKCSSNGATLSLEVDGSLRVLGLKELIAARADVPPENQRLIYSGKVLKDPETLESYSVADGHTIYQCCLPATGASALALPSTCPSGGTLSQDGTCVQISSCVATMCQENGVAGDCCAGDGSPAT